MWEPCPDGCRDCVTVKFVTGRGVRNQVEFVSSPIRSICRQTGFVCYTLCLSISGTIMEAHTH